MLVDTVDADGVEGRAAHQAPEVDGSTTLVAGGDGVDLAALRPGDLVRATVTGTEGVDLVAVPVEMISRGGPGRDRRPVTVPRSSPAAGAGCSTPPTSSPRVRLVLVPVFVALVIVSEMTSPGWRIAACLTFAFASATDLVDGWIARRFELVTSFGKVADPIADKALTGTRAGAAVRVRRAALVGDRGDPGPRVGHHRAAVLGASGTA